MTQGTFDMTQGRFDMTQGTFDMTQGTFDMTQGTFDMTQGTFDKTQGTFDMTQGTFDRLKVQAEGASRRTVRSLLPREVKAASRFILHQQTKAKAPRISSNSTEVFMYISLYRSLLLYRSI
jgi:hypothetical protein